MNWNIENEGYGFYIIDLDTVESNTKYLCRDGQIRDLQLMEFAWSICETNPKYSNSLSGLYYFDSEEHAKSVLTKFRALPEFE